MLKFFGQGIYHTATRELYGYELFLRQEVNHTYKVPDDFGRFSPKEVTELLGRTVHQLKEGQIVAINLDERQFIDERYANLLREVQRSTKMRLYVELTERLGSGDGAVNVATLTQAAQRFVAYGILVSVDDVGTDQNQSQLVEAMLPFVTKIKYAIQNVRQQKSTEAIKLEIEKWLAVAHEHQIQFALEGLESVADEDYIQQYQPDLVQGYYFDRPHLLES